MSVSVQLPQWQSHKIVLADKIVGGGVEVDRACWCLACGARIDLSRQLMARVPPKTSPIGGYYVRYEDGFESWSPAEAFEKGYTRLEPDGPFMVVVSRSQAIALLDLILGNLESNWPGEYPDNRLEYLGVKGFDLEDPEEKLQRLQEAGKTLVETYNLAHEFSP